MLIGIDRPVNQKRGWLKSSRVHSVPPSAGHEDIVCFSHLRWDFVYQRPQHLLSRAARDRRVFYIEEPRAGAQTPRMETMRDPSGVTVAIPHVPSTSDVVVLQAMIDFFLSAHEIRDFVAWYYTPLALQVTAHLRPVATVYDCMDELSAFAGAPPGLREAERTLLARADLVLTGGHSLYLAKRNLHANVHEFPSSVDVAHFAKARDSRRDPPDQAHVPRPRIGFFGVLDERLDRDLLAAVAAQRPAWHLMMIGPVAKIDVADLPTAPNLHYLGPKSYAELPAYIAGWDVAILPFARNEATRYISPTKTPEYLAAGRPVVSTSIADVVRPYGEQGLVRIADTPADFIDAVGQALSEKDTGWLARADAFLAGNSWDLTWERIRERLRAAIARPLGSRSAPPMLNTVSAAEPTTAG
jgi:glycosyltransferase involved in cell wall biosynthesis